EDGIRDSSVTGVQTCALPISNIGEDSPMSVGLSLPGRHVFAGDHLLRLVRWSKRILPTTCLDCFVVDEPQIERLDLHGNGSSLRSEERRVGKQGRSRWAGDER